MNYSTLRHPSAWLPLAMSLTALGLVVGRVIFMGTVRDADEGAVAHLFQLLIVAQLPIIAFFAIRWFRRVPRNALAVVALQVLAGAVACAPVWYFQL